MAEVQPWLFSASAPTFLRFEQNGRIPVIQETRKNFYSLVYLDIASQSPLPCSTWGLVRASRATEPPDLPPEPLPHTPIWRPYHSCLLFKHTEICHLESLIEDICNLLVLFS